MTKRLEVYKCDVCGIVEVLDGGAGEPVCCSQLMTRLVEKTEDAANEKHVPYVEAADGVVTVRVGQNAAHPMEEKHFIQWIELPADGKAYRQFVQPSDEPVATFQVTAQDLTARELCNIHGLWKG